MLNLKKQTRENITLYLSIAAIIISSISFLVDWKQFLFFQESNSPPDIIGCIRSFNYEKGRQFSNWIEPKGVISFDLVNRGNTEATVHRVDVFPYGKGDDGQKDSMWFTLEVQAKVEGNGITTVEEFNFTDTQVQENFWIEDFEGVWIQAFWPNGNGYQVACEPDIVTSIEGDWFCGYPQEDGLVGENACR
jgi:hypothetical protein